MLSLFVWDLRKYQGWWETDTERMLSSFRPFRRKGEEEPTVGAWACKPVVYPSLNGNVFTLLHPSRRLAIRLPEGGQEEFLRKHETKLFEA